MATSLKARESLRQVRRSTKTSKAPPVLILPALLWLVVFLIIPIGIILLFSVLHKGNYGKIDFFFDGSSYARLFEPLYLKIVIRSLWLAFYTTVLCLVLAYPFAYYMVRASEKTKKALLGLVIIPFWTNFVIRVYALKLVLPAALVDNVWGVAIGMVYNYLPFMVLPLFVALEKLDFTLLDAAYDLGATKPQMVISVLFPLSLPGVITGSLFVFIPAFGEFVIPDLLGGSQSVYVGSLITEMFLKSRDWPFGSALSSFLVLFAMVAFMFTLSRSAKSESSVHV